MMEAPTRADAGISLERFRHEFEAMNPKTIAKLDRDWQHLTAFCTSQPSTGGTCGPATRSSRAFATGKLRTSVTKGAGSKKAALAMAYKLLDAAKERWRRFNGYHLAADVLAGAEFKDGIRVTDDDNHDDGMANVRVAT